MSSDPQIWLFPPPGAPYPPLAQTSSFGPIRLNDSLTLSWSPPSQQPEVWLWCSPFTADGYAALTILVCNGVQSPFTHVFDREVVGVGSEGSFCHMSFLGTENGNSVVWNFQNEAAESPRTWIDGAAVVSTSSAGKAVQSSTTSSSSIFDGTSSLISFSTSSTPSTISSSLSTTDAPTSSFMATSTSVQQSDRQTISTTSPSAASSTTAGTNASETTGKPSFTLSPGASAGIGIGAAALVIFVVLLFWYYIRRYRRQRKAKVVAELQNNSPIMAWKPGSEYGTSPVVYELGTERLPELEGRRLGAGLNSPKN